MWSNIAPNEYGFYANVNPEVNRPRWSQASERRDRRVEPSENHDVQWLCRSGCQLVYRNGFGKEY